MNALNKLGAVLTAVFVVSVVVLLVEVIYVLWRRRRFRRRSLFSSGDTEFSGDSSFYATPSKELLYFFCWKNQTTRIEPDAASAPTAPPLPETYTDAEVDEMLKWQGLYGPSRVLFTIKEEEREEMETENSSPADKELVLNNKKKKKKKGSDCLEDEDVVAAVVVEVDEKTPFWTPCASPYYTPTPSPSRDGNSSSSSGNEDGVVSGGEAEKRDELQETKGVSGDNTASFVSIEVHTS